MYVCMCLRIYACACAFAPVLMRKKQQGSKPLCDRAKNRSALRQYQASYVLILRVCNACFVTWHTRNLYTRGFCSSRCFYFLSRGYKEVVHSTRLWSNAITGACRQRDPATAAACEHQGLCRTLQKSWCDWVQGAWAGYPRAFGMCVFVLICMCVCVCVYIYIYIYIRVKKWHVIMHEMLCAVFGSEMCVLCMHMKCCVLCLNLKCVCCVCIWNVVCCVRIWNIMWCAVFLCLQGNQCKSSLFFRKDPLQCLCTYTHADIHKDIYIYIYIYIW